MKYKFFLISFILFILLGIVTGGKENNSYAREFALYDPGNNLIPQLKSLKNWNSWVLWKQYPPLTISTASETDGSIADASLAHRYTLYLSRSGDGRATQYLLSFNSEPLTTAGYCQLSVLYSEADTGHASLRLQCAENYIYADDASWWEKTFRPNAILPIDMIGSIARLKLLVEQQN